MANAFGKNIWYNNHVNGNNGVFASSGAGAPTSGTSGTGVNIAGPGSTYYDITNKIAYTNTGTAASPTWSVEGTAATLGTAGTVTQITSRTTGVTLNTPVGAITLVSAAGSTTPASFTVTNSLVTANSVPVVVQKSGTDLYTLSVTAVAAGSFVITFNTKSGTTTEQPVFLFRL